MSEATSTRTFSVRRRLQNPVAVKELRSRMRGRRAFVVLTLYLLLLGGVLTLVYLAYNASSITGISAATVRTAGKSVFGAVLAVQVFLVLFIGPAFTAAAISGERERQTYDLLRTTLLSAESFVRGKLISALSYVFLLVLVSVPLQSIAFLLGGLSLTELVVSQLLILLAAVTYALYGLWCSATMRSTLAATVATFAGTLFMTAGIPLFALTAAVVLTPLFNTIATTGSMTEDLLFYGGLVLAAINLPATLILSEAFLLQGGTVFSLSQTVSGLSVWLPSPWLLFIVFHVLAAFLLYRATVRRVRRVSEV